MSRHTGNDLFKYQSQQPARTTSSAPYYSAPATISQYNPATRDYKSQGQFTISLQPVGPSAKLVVFRAGAAPLMTFQVTRQLKWTLSTEAYCFFTDPPGKQWLAQFQDRMAAAHATAAFATLLSVTNSKEICYYQPSPTSGRGIAEGDKVDLNYYVFDYGQWPVIQSCITHEANLAVVLSRDTLASGLVTGMLGMTLNTTRAVFIPTLFTGLGNGRQDGGFQRSNLMVVVTVNHIRFRDEKDKPSDRSESDVEPVVVAAPAVSAAPVPVPSMSAPREEPPPAAVVQAPIAESEEQIKDDKISRLIRMGAVASAVAPPRRVSDVASARGSEAPRTIETHSDQPSYRSPAANPIEARLEALERSVTAKLEAFAAAQNYKVVADVSSLAALVKSRQAEIDNLRKQIEEEKNRGSPQGQAQTGDALKREVEEWKRKVSDLEERAGDADRRVKEFEAKKTRLGDLAKDKASGLVKAMIQSVFNAMETEFQGNQRFDGEQVSDKLWAMLKAESGPLLSQLQKNGLF
jgi:cell division protein FtsL